MSVEPVFTHDIELENACEVSVLRTPGSDKIHAAFHGAYGFAVFGPAKNLQDLSNQMNKIEMENDVSFPTQEQAEAWCLATYHASKTEKA